ncbi:glycosyltransferase family 4 protein [Methanocaldococcus indicus]|uniref:glycosyltransferase family 4 protein n=1 Tax=Methanocaldococcus indicus TaxID=213231 RepID=UPI003C6D700E
MKVLMPTIYYPHLGGITQHVDNLVKNLKDIEFHILTYDYTTPKYKNVVIHNVNYLKKFRGISYLYNAYKLAKKIIEKEEIDLIHSHYAFPQGFLGALLKDKFNIPYILTLHGSDALFLKNSLKGKLFFNYSIKKADEVICVSKAIKNEVGKGVVIYNGIDIEKYKNLGDENYILYVGAFLKTKGVDILAEISKELNYKFIFIGDGPLFNKVKKIVKDNVILLGKKQHSEVINYLGRCSFVAVPSRIEGFGLVALEGFASYKPVVAFNRYGLRELITNNYNGFLANNKEEFKEYIITLMEDENLRKTLGKNARKTAEKFSWKKTAEKVREIYEKVISSQ